ncbi:hypothetical protein BCU30_026280 [Vibrio lentus]|uniref:hypothetical protein n=1 Tax=Vibrio lentus TaxID=136468 RepID=UPI0039A4776B
MRLNVAEQTQFPVWQPMVVVFVNQDPVGPMKYALLSMTVTPDDPRRPKNYSAQQYLRTEEEMCELFSDIPEALQNCVETAKRCNVTVRLGEYFLPGTFQRVI